MDRALIERLVGEAGLRAPSGGLFVPTPQDLERFAARVAEECAQIAEQTFEGDCSCDDDSSGFAYNGENSAAAIRKRFESP